MIVEGTVLQVADNTGVKKVRCIRILGSKSFAEVADNIIVSTISTVSNGRIKQGVVKKAVVVRTKVLRRKDGSVIHFDDNSVVLINDEFQPIGTRIFGPIPQEISFDFFKIASLAAYTV